MLEVSFDVMQSAALAALVAMVGRGIVKRVKFFQTCCNLGVIVAGPDGWASSLSGSGKLWLWSIHFDSHWFQRVWSGDIFHRAVTQLLGTDLCMW
ncbi:MAG: hypothetical protein ACLR0P_05710 [Oscillospiraceae bacterium]